MLLDKPIPKGFDAHPYIVETVSQCSDEIRTRALQSLPSGDVVRDIYVVPRYISYTRLSPPRFQPEHALIFTDQGLLSVQESDLKGEFPEMKYMRTDDMAYLRSSLILLYGKLEIVGTTSNQGRKVTMEYNTVRYELFKQVLYRFLFPPLFDIPLTSLEKEMEREAWKEFENLHIKFKNGLIQYSLASNEHLLGIVFQPTIYRPVISRLRLKVAFSTLLAITNRYLIVIGEEKAYRQTAYGWIITYYPLFSIHHIDSTAGQFYDRLVIHIRKNDYETRHEVKMDASTIEKFMKIWMLRKS